MHSVYSVALTFIGQSVGAKKYKNVKKLTVYSVLLVTAIGLSTGGIVLIFNKPLLNLYISQSDVAFSAAITRLFIIIPTYSLCGIMDTLCATLRSLDRSVTSMVISLTCTCGLRIVWINTVFAHFGTGQSLFLSYPVSWIVSCTIHVVFIVITTKKLLKKQREELLLE
jgi:Na+-driven multidrug efflux pump